MLSTPTVRSPSRNAASGHRAAQLNAALSYLKCTDPKLGLPTKEELEEDRKEFEERVTANITYRTESLGEDRLAEDLADEERRSANAAS